MPERPTGTVTFLFSDIEGSTRLLQQLRDRYDEVLSTHARLLRAVIDEFDGHEIDTQGDVFLVAFPRAHRGRAYGTERRSVTVASPRSRFLIHHLATAC